MTNSEFFGLESPTGPEEAQVPENAPPEFRILRTSDVDVEERSKLGLGPDEQPTALCLSGGGIRSAAFCLGVLQAFAARSLLHQVHYLSTVSGGGYIGGWLTRCIAEQNAKAPPEQGDVKAVLDRVLVRQGEEEAPELGRLRSFTNFLTPHPGIVSSDTWAGIELYARNTLINWTVFLPLMLAAAFVPIFYLFIVCYMGSLQSIDASVIVGIIGLASLAWAVHLTCIKLPSYTLKTPEPVQVDPQTMGLRERQGPRTSSSGRWPGPFWFPSASRRGCCAPTRLSGRCDICSRRSPRPPARQVGVRAPARWPMPRGSSTSCPSAPSPSASSPIWRPGDFPRGLWSETPGKRNCAARPLWPTFRAGQSARRSRRPCSGRAPGSRPAAAHSGLHSPGRSG